MKKIKLALLTAALATSSFAVMAQDKAALVKQFLELQRPAIEALSRGLVQQSSDPIAGAGSQYLNTQVPEAKREAAGKAADAVLKQYFDESYPIVRDKAVALAPSTIGPIASDNLSDEELRQLNAWLGSPLRKKYEDLTPKMGEALTKQLVADTRSVVEPKLKALDENVAKALGAPVGGASAAKSPAKAPSKK